MKWDPEAYLSFDRPRLQPALDLISKIPSINPKQIADIGCGPGNVTQILKQKWPTALVKGYDSSQEMLTKAKKSFPELNWENQSADNLSLKSPLDLLFSNACLQWLPDHHLLFPKLIAVLAEEGVLAVQMPNNYNRPTHRYVYDAAVETKMLGQLEHLFTPSPVASASKYYDILSPLVKHIEIWETDYLQTLEGDNPVADWTKGSYLRPFLSALPMKDANIFEQCYRDLIQSAYPKQENGVTLLSFKRLFMLAIK